MLVAEATVLWRRYHNLLTDQECDHLVDKVSTGVQAIAHTVMPLHMHNTRDLVHRAH